MLYLGSIGEQTVLLYTGRILSSMLTNDLAVKFSMYGKGAKLGFAKLHLHKVVQSKVVFLILHYYVKTNGKCLTNVRKNKLCADEQLAALITFIK